MMDKELPGMTYAASRRTLPNGKTEYRSVTTVEDATAEEMMVSDGLKILGNGQRIKT
jgi:hypothetical protein